MSTSRDEHLRNIPRNITYCLIVTSDRVYAGVKEDKITPIVEEILAKHGHSLRCKVIVPNSLVMIRDAVIRCTAECDVLLITGGTGPRPRDLSVEAVENIAKRKLPGFGELFRMKTFNMHGTISWLTRAAAYVIEDTLVFVTPGSLDAVKMALEEIILPEAGHALGEIRRR